MGKRASGTSTCIDTVSLRSSVHVDAPIAIGRPWAGVRPRRRALPGSAGFPPVARKQTFAITRYSDRTNDIWNKECSVDPLVMAQSLDSTPMNKVAQKT